MVKLLLSHGADIDLDLNDGEGRTPLSYACCRGHEKVVALLLDRGADVEKARGSGFLSPELEAKAHALIEQRKATAAGAATATVALASCGASGDGAGMAASATAAAGPAGAVVPPVASAAVLGPNAVATGADTTGEATASSFASDAAATPPAADSRPSKQCAQCAVPKSTAAKLFKCSGCQAVRYCSAACQALHWREGGHKRECKSLRAQQQHADEGEVAATDD